MSHEELKKQWADKAAGLLVGKRITRVRYLTDEEIEGIGWHSAAIVLQLDDGTFLWPSSDDEGNNAGAMFTTDEKLDTIPVI